MTYIRSRKHAVDGALTATAATALVTALVALPAHAQGADPQAKRLKDVVVSADAVEEGYKADVSASPKATAALVDTPQTVTVIKEQLFKEQAATTLTEALQNSPGVGTFYLGENGNTSTGDAVFMRGVDVSGSIFVNGVRDIGAVSRDVFNVEQVEVLKGAAGTDIGRGAATGAIALSTKQPKLADSRSASVGYGSGDYKRATADLNANLGGGMAARLNLMIQDAGVAGRDRIKNDRWGIAPSVAFGLDTPTRLYLNYVHIDQDNVPDGGVVTIGLPGYSSPDAKRPFLSSAPRVDSANFYGTTADHDDNKTNSFAVVVEHDLASGLTVSNQTRYSEVEQVYRLTSFMATAANFLTPDVNNRDTWTFGRLANNRNALNSIWANLTNIRGSFETGGFSHTFSAGLDLTWELQKTRTVGGVGTLPPVSAYNPDPNVTSYSTTLTGAYVKGTTDTAAIYLNDAIAFTPQLQLNGGLRLDHYKTHYRSVAATGVATELEAKDDLLSGKVGLVYKPQANGSVYVSYAVTRQPPGGANFTLSATNSANANNPDVEPQTAKTYEAGTKWDVADGRLSLTGAVYRTQYSDQILTDTDGTYYRAGAKRVQGVELGVQGQITPDWAMNAGYTVMHTKVSSPTGQVVTADGSRVLAYNPSSAFTLWTTYRLPFGLTVGGGARYAGKLKRGSDGAVGTPAFADSYWVFNAMASYRVTPNLDLQLNVYNLTDEDYVASINKSGYRYTPGVPRSVRLTANLAF